MHRRFTVDQIEKARAEHPGVRVIVHPECPMAVVDAADEAGSTDYIAKAIEAAPAGSTFAIGTEVNLVQRLAADNPQHTIFCLDPVVCPCSTMYRIHPGYLAWVLEGLVDGGWCNRITVPEDVADPARLALERMLAAKPPAAVAATPAPRGIRDGSLTMRTWSWSAAASPASTALQAVDAGHAVELVTKDVLEHANTRYAQGGIAAVMFADDSAEHHIRDTIAAGAGLSDPEAVRVLVDEGPARIRELIRLGVAFDRGDAGLERPRGRALLPAHPALRRRRDRHRDREGARRHGAAPGGA